VINTDRPEKTRQLKLAVGIALQPRIARSGVLTSVVVAGGLSVGIVVVARSIWGSDSAVERALQLGVMLLAASIGPALDDPTEPTVGPAPIPLRARRAFRLMPAVTVGALAWAVGVAIAGGDTGGSHTIMLAGLATTGTAVAALAAPQRAGVAGAGFVLAAAFVLTRLPDRWAMLPDPTTGLDQPAKLRWAATIAIGLAIFIYTSRDPGQAHIRSGPAQIEPSQASPARRL
jgi:hypothetical protein